MENYEVLFETAKVEQLKQLKANEHKTGWNNLSLSDVVRYISNNHRTLQEELYDNDIDRSIKCLADIANVASMGILKLNKRARDIKSLRGGDGK